MDPIEKFNTVSRAYYQCLGEVVVYWNGCEGRLRDLVVWLAGGKTVANLALTADMSAKALVEALPALAGAQEPEIRGHLEYYAKAVDILREHRNYYVHGIGMVTFDNATLEPAAWISTITGRNRLKLIHEQMTLEPLIKLKGELLLYSVYGFDLVSKLDPQHWTAKYYSRPAPLRERPPLPDRLKKPPPTLLGAPRPPGSSPV